MAQQVKAFIPIDITDARFVSSTIAEPDADEPAWNSGATYNEFDTVSVISADSHLVYESLQNSNTNKNTLTETDWWILKSFTNRHRMFDWRRGSKSQGASPMTVVVRPGRRINAITLEGIRAATADITVQDGIGGPVVMTISKDLLNRHAVTPYQWTFAPWIYDKVLSTFDVPPVADPVVTVTLTDPSGTCELARFATGLAVDLGEMEWDSAFEDEDLSPVTRNEFGEATFSPLPSIPTLESEMEVLANQVNIVRQFKADAKGKTVIFSGMEALDAYREMHTIVGFFRRFRVTVKNHKYTKFDIRIEGL